MNNNNNIELLFRYACDHKFEDFDILFSKMEEELPLYEFWEAYLMRAQIKLYTTDLTLLDDLAKAEQACAIPRFPLLFSLWQCDTVNHFIIYPKAFGALKTFLAALPQVSEKFSLWYGTQSCNALLQLQGEILYFMGDIEAALPFAEAQRGAESKNHIDTILALNLEYRCYLALIQPEKAHECMFNIIRHSKAYPECVEIYREFRQWANLTTGWSGDSPRFYEDEEGKKQPVLADRLEGIKLGIARDTPFESPFLKYAVKSYEGTYRLKQYYMDWFHAMYWLSIDDRKQAESYFKKVYEIMLASSLLMPIIECGEQVMPLLKHMQQCDANLCLDNLMLRAARYEEGLKQYRLADN